MKRLILILASAAVVSTAFATTYVRVEKDGSKTYSDRPLPGGQPVELDPVQTYSAPASTPNPNQPLEQRLLKGIDDFNYTSCSLTPANDETFTNPESVTVSVNTDPAIRGGDVVELNVDGSRVAADGMSVTLQPVDRGTHTAQVNIKDAYGRVLCSASTSFHVMRPSINLPARR